MRLKEDITKWFIRNIVMSKQEVIDHPGFIVCQYTEKGKTTFLRELVFPEDIWVNFEKRLVERYGSQGKQTIYSAGKRFGYSYTHASNFSKKKNVSRKTFEDNVFLFMRYAECMWTNSLEHEVDYDKNIFKGHFKDFIVCSKSGMGYLMLAGCVGGWWAYLIDDETVEGVQTKCVGRGDSECELICGPKKALQDYPDFFAEIELPIPDYGRRYVEINRIQSDSYARTSFKDLIYSKQFIQTGGIIMYGPHRHFICESSLFYFVENELRKIEGGEKVLFECAFDYGKKLAAFKSGLVKEKYVEYITDYMSGTGWGSISIKTTEGRHEVVAHFFPWTEVAETVHFAYFRGLVSGLLSGFLNKEVLLENIKTHITGAGFTLIVSEK